MDNRLKEIYDNLDKMKIGLNEEFKFNCTMCGKCCKNRDDILLNPKDIFQMAEYLDMRMGEFLKMYCEIYVGQSSRFPIVRLLPIGIDRRCPFLKGTRCSINSVKPVVCALFPIGRCLTVDSSKGNELNVNDITYINQNPDCGDKRKTHTVREWLKTSNVPTEDEFFIKWHTMLSTIAGIIHKIEEKVAEDKMNEFYQTLIMLIYLAYNFEDDFLYQFDRNAKHAIEIARNLEENYNG